MKLQMGSLKEVKAFLYLNIDKNENFGILEKTYSNLGVKTIKRGERL